MITSKMIPVLTTIMMAYLYGAGQVQVHQAICIIALIILRELEGYGQGCGRIK